MKVGTDGVLLGAWAEGGRRVLDIGTGTGLIALMMAQRFPMAEVTGIDIDDDACAQARENILSSPFHDRIKIEHKALQSYAEDDLRYDSIVSNPPFFEGGIRNPDEKRNTARHTDTLSLHDLFVGVDRLLSDEGVFSMVMPADRLRDLVSEGIACGFAMTRKCCVRTKPQKPVSRCLVEFSRSRTSLVKEEHFLMDFDVGRSEWYSALTEDFYLNV